MKNKIIPNFITYGDEKYFKSIKLSISQTKRFYPESNFYVYDIGFTKKQKDFFNSQKNVVLIEWKTNYSEEEFSGFLRHIIQRIPKLNSILKKICHNPDMPLTNKNFIKEYLLSIKVNCILDAATRSNENPLIFLDGDAFLINKIDEIFKDEYDIGVTIREDISVSTKKVDYEVNSGVIILNTSKYKKIMFVNKWMQNSVKLSLNNVALIEQTALNRLAKSSFGKDFPKNFNKLGELKIAGERIKIKLFPNEGYNYNHLERGYDKEKNKILHCKGNRNIPEEFL
jgi:hypothetical protein